MPATIGDRSPLTTPEPNRRPTNSAKLSFGGDLEVIKGSKSNRSFDQKDKSGVRRSIGGDRGAGTSLS